MKTIETSTEDSVKMVRAIREKHYEETKNMTREEKREYYRKKVSEFKELRKQINLEDYDFPFLHKK